MRKQFQMSSAQMDAILKASEPVPYIVVGGMEPSSPQERANHAWQHLAKELGFVWDSARPVSGEGMDVFTAEEAASGDGE